MKAVCNGESKAKCGHYSDRCRVTPLSIKDGCSHMRSISKHICNGNEPLKCPRIDGMFSDMRDWAGSDCGVVDGKWCVSGTSFT